ncbi:glycosyltransferase [uncultured Desulfovibrio sp.]|uniref:Glycosyltransferase n=1 Tax=Candidatus Desulfovibrio intestinavium TaxID=2838534 RepID=A0A9D2HMT2_9BACT|nr:glycosyltransferase [uncultured Desulfovibrio sp.]HJA79072.1 glycosyltransferase [Candidatus Desulfovibrio intestinavium]
MRVALVHYWLSVMGGGEKVLEALCRLYPQADIYTHVLRPENLPAELRRHAIRTTFINALPGSARHYQKYLPLMPLALEQLDLTAYDLVISSESGPAKGVITRPDALHLCYCHSPMRYLWDSWPTYQRNAGRLTRLFSRLLLPRLRRWDYLSAQRVDRIVANSRHVARRVRKYWRREAAVVHPPVDTRTFAPRESPGGEHYLCFGRLTCYKRVDLAVQACTRLQRPLIVIGDGEDRRRLEALAGPSVRFLGRQEDATVRELLSRSRALLFPGEEDFGIVPVEAMSAGVPVIAYGRGGARETVRDGVTGLLFAEQTPEALEEAIRRFESCEATFDPAALHAHAEHFSEERFARGMLAEVEKGFQDLRMP